SSQFHRAAPENFDRIGSRKISATPGTEKSCGPIVLPHLRAMDSRYAYEVLGTCARNQSAKLKRSGEVAKWMLLVLRWSGRFKVGQFIMIAFGMWFLVFGSAMFRIMSLSRQTN